MLCVPKCCCRGGTTYRDVCATPIVPRVARLVECGAADDWAVLKKPGPSTETAGVKCGATQAQQRSLVI